jgi:hypothetical protein
MPGAGQTKPAVTPRLPDRIAIGVLTRTFPPELVDRVVTQTGRVEQRQRLLPARVVLYYTLAMCLRPGGLRGGHAAAGRGPGLGQALAGQLAGSPQELDRPGQTKAGAGAAAGAVRRGHPAAGHPGDPGGVVSGVAAAGTGRHHPGRTGHARQPGGVRPARWGRGPGAPPQVRLVGLVECGTHAVVDAAMGGLHLGEGSLAPSLARSLGPGMLLLVDQGLCSLELWRSLQARGRSWCGAVARTSSWRC